VTQADRKPATNGQENGIMAQNITPTARKKKISKAASPALKAETNSGALALQVASGDGRHFVDLQNIRVAIYPSGKSWIAQGFEIDYVAQGGDVDSVKKALENGLEATIHQHVKVYGHIKHLLRFAPVHVRLDVLDRVFQNPEAMTPTYSQVSVHNCPPVKIEFLELAT
jgi:hypothetical protein